MSELKDSGARREFESGAVRDIQEGKGRCDLLPLRYVGCVIDAGSEKDYVNRILNWIGRFREDGDPGLLIAAARYFIEATYPDVETALLELAKHYEDGARKYSDRNWEKGIDLHCFIDSGIRHLLKWSRGDRDEPHDRAFLWNMFGAVWTFYQYPDLDDFTIKKEQE